MSRDELLKYAKENYPIGTKFHSAFKKSIEIAETEAYFYFGEKDYLAVKGAGGVIYNSKKEWAEIISYPEGYKIPINQLYSII